VDSRQRRRERRRGGRPPEGLDLTALDGIARFAGWILIQKRRVPFVKPIDAAQDQMDFDRTLCAAGVTEFVRAAMPGEVPDELAPLAEGELLLVQEAMPGLRLKVAISVDFFDVTRN
jgi:hypothetical protein